MSFGTFQKVDSHNDSLVRFHEVLYALLPLLLGLELVFWIVFVPIGLRGDSDFSIFYTAGTMLRTGNAHRLFDYNAELEVERSKVSQTPAPYNHLPYEGLIFVPISKLPYRAAYIAFACCNFILAVASWWQLKPNSRAVSALFAAYFPVSAAMADGQDSIILLAITISVWRLFSTQREGLAGALLGLALFRFTLVLPIVGLLLLWKRWRFVGAFALSSASVLLFSFWLVGVGQMRLYSRHLLSLGALAPQEAGYYSLTYALPRMMNIRGFFLNVVQNAHIGLACTLISSFILLIWVAWAGHTFERTQQFVLAIAFSVLVSYHMFIYDLTILLIPMAAALEMINHKLWRPQAAVLLPLLGVPITYLWKPYLAAIPLMAFLALIAYCLRPRFASHSPVDTLELKH